MSGLRHRATISGLSTPPRRQAEEDVGAGITSASVRASVFCA
jgi:hypothetical protein